MSNLTNASVVLQYLRSLIWPAIVLIALVMFREPLRALLGSVEEFEGFGIRAKIGRRLNGAAEEAQKVLDAQPVYRTSSPGAPWPTARDAANRMNVAVNIRFNAGQAGAQNSVDHMRWAVDALDGALIAILVLVGTSGWKQADVVRSGYITSRSIEVDLVEFTGIVGWNAVIQSRNILGRAVGTICGRSARKVRAADVRTVIVVAEDALDKLRALVTAFSASVEQAG